MNPDIFEAHISNYRNHKELAEYLVDTGVGRLDQMEFGYCKDLDGDPDFEMLRITIQRD